MGSEQGKRKFYNVSLIGFMGTGKTTVGRLVAARLHYGFIDTDHLIEMRVGKSITKIFEEEGEARFREYEKAVVAELESFRKMVIATGGGLGANSENLESLKKHSLVVCLWASPETIYERIKKQTHRPLLQTPEPLTKIRELLALREPVYRQADVLISTDKRTTKEVAQQVIFHLRLARSRAAQIPKTNN
ncbi:MAG: shikimate kinase [Verrucomicrobiia bacterium]|jgi:shikimate kinase